MPDPGPQTPSPQAPQGVTIAQWKGLKNTVTAERLAPGELERAVNVDIDDAEQLRRRRGYMRKVAGAFHSPFQVSRGLLVAKDGRLTLVHAGSYQCLDLGCEVGSDPLSYVQVGADVYFSSRSASGVVRQDLSVDPWGAEGDPGQWLSPVVNPTATLGAVAGKLVGAPPMATALALFNGRIYLAEGSTLWATELYLYNYVNKTRSFLQFESEITALGAVTDGLYVGTQAGLYFLSGTFGAMQRVLADTASVVPRSMTLADPGAIGAAKQSQTRTALICVTDAGVVACLDRGITFNITQDQFVFPQAVSAAPLFRAQDGMNQYVVTLESGGTPSAAVGISDYAEAEIRRANRT